MNTLTLGLLLSSVCVAVLSSPTHSGGKNGSGAKCKPRTVCSQVPSSKCNTVYEERCSQPTKEVCDQVTRVSQHNRCTTTYSRVCTGGNRDTRDRKQERKQRKEARRGKRSPVGILQAVLLANALSARHPIENEETCHNVPTHHCQSSPVENVVHQCKKVSDGASKCEKVPVKKCSSVTSQQCRQVCA